MKYIAEGSGRVMMKLSYRCSPQFWYVLAISYKFYLCRLHHSEMSPKDDFVLGFSSDSKVRSITGTIHIWDPFITVSYTFHF